MSSRVLNESFFYWEGSDSGKNMFRWVAGVGGRSREKRVAGSVELISSAGVVELRIHVSVSAMMSGLWLSVRSLSAVTCSGMSMVRVLRVEMRRFAGLVGPGFC